MADETKKSGNGKSASDDLDDAVIGVARKSGKQSSRAPNSPQVTSLKDGVFSELNAEDAEEALQGFAEVGESIADDADADAHARHLLTREISKIANLGGQRGILEFIFSEARVPAEEEIVIVTREWHDNAPWLDALLDPHFFIGEQDGPEKSIIFTRSNSASPTGFQWIVDAREQDFANFAAYRSFVLATFDLMLPNETRQAANRIWMPLATYGAQRVEFVATNLLRELARSWVNAGNRGDARIEIALVSELSEDEHAALRDAVADLGFDDILDTGSSTSATDDSSREGAEDLPPETTEDLPELHPDRPIGSIDEDDLGRAAIAETIVKNVTHVWTDQIEHSRPFAVHLSGRWGSGKSSILNFLREKLEQETTHSPVVTGPRDESAPQGWVVVDYNAWQMQGTGPAWWTLRNAVVEAGKVALGRAGRYFAFRDRLWQIKQGWEPWLVVAAVILATLSASAFFFLESGDLTSRVIETKAVSTKTLSDGTLVTETDVTSSPIESPDTFLGATSPIAVLTAVATVVGALGAIATFIRGFLRTSNETAEAIQTLQTDPTEVLKDRFAYIIKEEIKRPVAVFIDDLD
ncbi:MAG: P-loop NTPase fold protein, partial [Pseudomonadota bacterium]